MIHLAADLYRFHEESYLPIIPSSFAVKDLHLIRRMSKENPTWDVPRIASELALLGHDIAEGTVAKCMVRTHTSHSWIRSPGLAVRICRSGGPANGSEIIQNPGNQLDHALRSLPHSEVQT